MTRRTGSSRSFGGNEFPDKSRLMSLLVRVRGDLFTRRD